MNHWTRNMIAACLVSGLLVAQPAAADEFLRDARQYLEKGEQSAAIIQLKNALQRDPGNAEARELLGLTYLGQGDGASAEKELEQAIELGRDRKVLLPSLGRAWLLQGKVERVLAEIDGAGLEGAALAEHLFLRGQAAFMQEDRDQAEAQFAAALDADPEHVDSLVGQARLLFGKGDHPGASERLEKALKLSSDHADAWTLSGELQRQAGNVEAAEDRFNRALALNPHHMGAHLGRATIYLGQGQYEATERDIENILQRAPRHPIAHYLKGLSAYQQGRLDAAVKALQQTANLLPDHAATQLLLGTIRYQQGQFNQSIQHLRPFVATYPEHVPGAKLLAASLLRAGERDAAIAVLETTLAKSQGDAQLLAMLGSAYLERGDSSKGLEYLGQASELAPDTAAIQTQLAIGHILAGDSQQASDELQAAVNLGQGLIQADILLVVTYLNNREVDKALEAVRALQARLPDDPMPYNLLGAVYLQQGDAKAARQAFGGALEKNPGFQPARLNLARLDVAEGELDRARERFQEVLTADGTNLNAMFGMIDLAHMQGRPEEVGQWLERAVKQHPGAVKPGVLLVEHHLRSGQPLKALDVARTLSEQQPDHPDVLRVMGLAQMATDSGAAALANFRRLADLLPENVQAQYLLGSAALKEQNLPLARTALNKVLELDSSHAGALFSLGSLYLGANDGEEAARYASLLREHHASQPWGYALEADLLAARGEFQAAAEQAHLAYGRDPSRARLLSYHRFLKQAGAHQDAAGVLEAWLQSQPDDGEVRLRAAMDLQEQGQLRLAMEHYEQLLTRQPDQIIALNNLAWLYLEEDLPRALEYAGRAYQVSPERPEVLDTYGWSLVRNGELQKGLPLLQDALVKAPHLAQIRYHVAVALHQTGRTREARRELEQALRTQKFEGREAAQSLYESLVEQGH